MKKILGLLFMIFGSSVLAQPVTITQNNDVNTITAGGLVCSITEETEDIPNGLIQGMYFENHFARAFDLQNDHGIDGEFVISSVGIAQRTGINISVDINLYTANTDDLTDPAVDLTLVATETLPIFDLNNSEFLFVNINAVIPAGEILVVEVFAPDSEGATDSRFSIGINSAGQTKPTYIKAPDCDVDNFILSSSLGAGDEAYIMSVTGEETLSINENVISKIEIFPNPVTNFLTINLPTNVVLNEVLLIDMNAKIQNVKYVDGVIDVSDLPSGQYMLKLRTSSGIFIHKVIKK